MKLNQFIVIALAGMLSGTAFAVAPKPEAPAANGRVDVQFLEPKNYTDVRGSSMDTDDRNGYLDQIRDHIVTASAEYLPPGQKLQITFTDVDLAGDFPPGRPAAVDSVRVMKNIYPPRMAFSYRVTDEAGNVVKQGKEELIDKDFMALGKANAMGDPLRYDKALLSDWFRKEFGRK